LTNNPANFVTTLNKLLAEQLESNWRKRLIEQQQLGFKAQLETAKAFQMFANSKKQLTSNKYITLACNRAAEFWSGVQFIHQIATRDIEHWRLELQNRGYANQSIKHMLNQVSGTIKYVKRMGYRADAISEVLSQLGFSRSTAAIFGHVNSIVDAMVKQGSLKSVDEKLMSSS
jgi:hypothetical protein